MVKNIILYIFIYVFVIGCDDNLLSNECSSNCYMSIDAPDLVMDNNGYYHMVHLSNYTQTFTTLRAMTGYDGVIKIGWHSNTEVLVDGYWTQTVNEQSYTDENGIGYTILSSWEILVGDTIIVISGFHDDCENHYTDILKVVIDGE